MTAAEKFTSDCKRIKKHERHTDDGVYTAARACERVAALFEQHCPSYGTVPAELTAHWYERYIRPSPTPDEEPTDAHIQKLSAFIALFAGDSAGTEPLSSDDWTIAAECIASEAETIPLDALSALMALLLEKKALER
ncbi:MAG: hypothetical protein IJ191_09445 [Treponema sp.]|nr:hypothetical protein [Treponema sp.]